MDAADFGTFDRAFGRVCGAFRLKVTAKEREELTRTYFKVLEPYDLEAVLTVGRTCLERHKKFPTVADWLEAFGADTAPRPIGAIDARQLTASERAEYAGAARVGFDGGPCCCVDCSDAGVTDGIRFVPTLVNGIEDRAWDPEARALVVVGHWAHGAELARWYAARAACFATVPRGRVRQLVLAALTTREPGEEG